MASGEEGRGGGNNHAKEEKILTHMPDPIGGAADNGVRNTE